GAAAGGVRDGTELPLPQQKVGAVGGAVAIVVAADNAAVRDLIVETVPISLHEGALCAADLVVVGREREGGVRVPDLGLARLRVDFQANALNGGIARDRGLIEPAVVGRR